MFFECEPYQEWLVHSQIARPGWLKPQKVSINKPPQDMLFANGPIPLDMVHTRENIYNDLVDVLDAVVATTPQFILEAVRSLYDLYAGLPTFYQQGEDLR